MLITQTSPLLLEPTKFRRPQTIISVENIKHWLLSNKREAINATKTECLENIPSIHMINNPLKRVEFSKSLGVFFDNKLAWTKYIDHIAKKISPAIGRLRRVRPYALNDILKNIDNALTHTLLITVMSFGIDRLPKLKNRTARVIASANYDIHSVDILKLLH